jgi:hypothetical protein
VESQSVSLTMNVKMPLRFLQRFLQSVRDFETQDEEHFRDMEIRMVCDAPEVSAEELKAILESIRPPFTSGVVVVKI